MGAPSDRRTYCITFTDSPVGERLKFQCASQHFCSPYKQVYLLLPCQVYSFEKHQRQPETTTIYSCHVLILEGIFALHDPRVLELLDMKVGYIHSLQRSVIDIML